MAGTAALVSGGSHDALAAAVQHKAELGQTDDPVGAAKTKEFVSGQGARATAEAQSVAGGAGGVKGQSHSEVLGNVVSKGQFGPDHDAVREKKFRDFAAGQGARATAEAQRDKPAAMDGGAAEDVLWARKLAGDDRALAQNLLGLRHSLDDPEFTAWLETNAKDAARLDYAKTNLTRLGPPFDAARFALYFARQADVAVFESLLGLGAAPWTVIDIQSLLTATADRLAAGQQTQFLKRCASEGWGAATAAALAASLAGKVGDDLLADIGATEAHAKAVTALLGTWSAADVGAVAKSFHGKAKSIAEVPKFLQASAACEFTAEQASTLVAKCRAAVLVAISDAGNGLQSQLKDVKTQWPDFGKMGTLLGSFINKHAEFAALAKFLKACTTHTWGQDQAQQLVAALNGTVLKEVADTADVQSALAALGDDWTFTERGKITAEFHQKVGDVAQIPKFLKGCKAAELVPDQTRKLVDGCRKEILVGFADMGTDLQSQIKAVKATWTDFKKMALLFEAFYTKQPDCAMMAKLVKASAKYSWKQDNVKLLVDVVAADPLKQVAENVDLQTQIENVGKKWTNWTELADVIETGHNNTMTVEDKTDLLKECATQYTATKYKATQAKSYILTAVQAGDYTWKQRLEQAVKFRGHTQPAGPNNSLAGPFVAVQTYVAGNPPYRVHVRLPDSKAAHFKDGHSYSDFYFSVPNCHRSNLGSSMWAPGTNITARATQVAGGGYSAEIDNAAWNSGNTKKIAGNYTIAYSYAGPAGNNAYAVAIGQFFPNGGWLHHMLKPFVAEAIGRLRGYIN